MSKSVQPVQRLKGCKPMEEKQYGEFRLEQTLRLSKAQTKLFLFIEEEKLNTLEAIMLLEVCKHELQHNALYKEDIKKEEKKEEVKNL